MSRRKFSPDMLSAIDGSEEKKQTDPVVEVEKDEETVEIKEELPKEEQVEETVDEIPEPEAEEIVEKPVKTRKRTTKTAEKKKTRVKGKQITFTIDADLYPGLVKNLKYGDSLSGEINRQLREYQTEHNILKG